MSDIRQNPDFPFVSPSMRCHPIIDTLNVQFHKADNEIPIKLFEEPYWRFGTCDITIRGEIPIASNRMHVFFTIDASGSMNDRCVDGRRKMEYILYTLENILRIFHSKLECNISVFIQTFDSKIKTIFDSEILIKEHILEDVISSIKGIKAGDSTNIELALQSAKEKIGKYKEANLEHEIIHIFLTDGEITSGNESIEILKSLVSEDCKNIFIGYGLDHDSKLLMELSDNSKDDYRFVDVLERAGLVYGEIVHSILYKAVEDVSIMAENCDIYDYKRNMWVSELKIGDLLSEQKKTFHLRSNVLSRQRIVLFGKIIIKTMQYQIVNDIIEEQISNGLIIESDLTKYIFRQKTQELLYESRVVSEKRGKIEDFDLYLGLTDKKKEVKEKLKVFLKCMKDYMKEYNLEMDLLMKTLCDDIYISYMTIGTILGNMYTSARQVSQGSQHSYTVSGINAHVDHLLGDLDEDEILPIPSSQRRMQYNMYEDDIGIDVSLNQVYLSPYATQGMIQTMREVSGDNTLELGVGIKTQSIN